MARVVPGVWTVHARAVPVTASQYARRTLRCTAFVRRPLTRLPDPARVLQLVSVASTDPDLECQLRARLAAGRSLVACGRRTEARSLLMRLLGQTSRKVRVARDSSRRLLRTHNSAFFVAQALVQHRVRCLLQLATLPLSTSDYVAQPASPTAVAQALPWLLEAVSECTRRKASVQCVRLHWVRQQTHAPQCRVVPAT